MSKLDCFQICTLQFFYVKIVRTRLSGLERILQVSQQKVLAHEHIMTTIVRDYKAVALNIFRKIKCDHSDILETFFAS